MQNYSNHARYYTPHHFIFYPVIAIFIFLSARCIFQYPEDRLIWVAVTIIFIMITWASYMMRQHYALTVQNRVVRLEMRLRYSQLTNQRFEPIETKLSFGQIAALRFASDEELIDLIQRVVHEDLSPSIIKKSIKQWLPDHMRV
jgi:hypothetical protein